MTLTEQQIQDNYKELRKIINDTFSGLRLDKLNYMYDDLEDRMVVAPASSVEHYHNSKVGGYVEHILHVIKFSQQISRRSRSPSFFKFNINNMFPFYKKRY